MSVAQQLPFVYTPQQLLDMCVRALKSADECQSEAALVRGKSPQIRVVGDDAQARLIDDMKQQSDALDAKAKVFVGVAREHADKLVGQEIILTGVVYYDTTVYNTNNHFSDIDELDDYVIGCGSSDIVVLETTLDRVVRTITRVKFAGGRMLSSNKVVFYFQHNDKEHYFRLPLGYGEELTIEFL